MIRRLALLVPLLCLPVAAPAAQCAAASGERRVALLELYTSEGCDSCPPADRWMSGLPARGLGLDRLIVLGFHVDYWNYLGWPDPYAQRRYTERQQSASARNRSRFVYTPQLLLDGRDYRRGFRDDFAERIAVLNRREPGAAIRLEISPARDDGLAVRGEVTLNATHVQRAAQLWLALYENRLSSNVTAGENRGQLLHHDAVVRELAGPYATSAQRGSVFSHTFRIERAWKRKDLVAAAFVQDGATGEVLQAVALPYCG